MARQLNLKTRGERVFDARYAILQGGVACGAAYWVAHDLLHHYLPFFAPMSALIVLGLSGGQRLRRAVEFVFGVALGVGLGDLLISYIGSGPWQITLVVFISLAVGLFIDKGVVIANQAAFGSMIVATLLPPGDAGGFQRMQDAIIGGVIGIIVMAILPTMPLAGGRREIAHVLELTADVLDGVATGLKKGDSAGIAAVLEKARGTQGAINNMLAAAKEGEESSQVSPLLWRSRHRVRSLVRVLVPVDNCMRNARVLARRAEVLTEDTDSVSEEQLAAIEELAAIARELCEMYTGESSESAGYRTAELVRRLRILANNLGAEVAEGRVLSAQVILGQSRSIVVDLLQVCGLSKESAQAALKPTSETPAHPPEILDD